MDVDTKAMVKAFTKQIETIYRKRFGLKAEHVRAIMDGEAGRDGTYFDAQAAVKAGIIPAENIIHTSKLTLYPENDRLLKGRHYQLSFLHMQIKM